jgi:hypothetical protein
MTDYPDQFIVICRGDSRDVDGVYRPGDYVLTTRTVFDRREEAEAYAKSVAPSREAIVVEGRWCSLRLP